MNPLLAALVEAGVLSQADAERIHRNSDPAAARAHAEQMLTDAFARGLTAQQRRILSVLDEAQGNPTPRALERLWAQENDLLWASVGDDLRDVATEQAVRASIGAVDANTWMLVNEEVVNWVDQTYTSPDPVDFGSIPNLNQTSRSQFADAFQRWQLGDRTAGNYAQGLPQLLAELQPIFGRTRAERIGVTETTRVFSQSEIAAGNVNPFIDAWLYNTANDSYVSDLCRSGEGAIMLKGESVFSDGKGPPPRHVRCRSSISQLSGPALAALREEGFVQPGRGPLPVVGTAVDDGAVVVTPEPIASVGVPKFKTTDEAQTWARANHATYADYATFSVDAANNMNEAISKLPPGVDVDFAGNYAYYQKATTRKLTSQQKDSTYGVSLKSDIPSIDLGLRQKFGIRLTQDNAAKPVNVVAINTQKYKTPAEIERRKLIVQAQYERQTGRKYFFNTAGRATAHHEIGHVVANNADMTGWSDIASEWARSSEYDVLKSDSEAFAEAWAAFHTEGTGRLPDNVVQFIGGIIDAN